MFERYPFLAPLFERVPWAHFRFLRFVRAVESFRGRAIRLWPVAIPAPLQFGLWLAGRETDYIFYEARTARVHQEHIIAHEISHMLLGHQTLQVATATHKTVNALLAGLAAPEQNSPPAPLLRDLLSLRSREHEAAAEELALILQQELIRRAHRATLPAHSPPALWREAAASLGLVD